MRHTNTLLSSMAVADLVGGGFCIPLSAIVGLLLPHQILAERHFCLIDLATFSFTSILFTCSLLHLTMIAWERYIAIRKWIDYKVIVTRSRLKKLAIIAWVSAIVTVSPLPLLVITGIMSENAMILASEIFHTVLSVSVMSALGLIVYFYVMVYLGVRKRKLSQIHQVSELVNAKLERRVAMTTALVTAALILSFFPNALIGMLEGVYPVLRKHWVIRLLDTLLYSNSVVNPLIYCYRDCRFRNAVLEILKIRKPEKRPSAAYDVVRSVRRKDLLGSVIDTEVQIQKRENQVLLTRSASCDLVLFTDQARLDSHQTSLKRTMSTPSLHIKHFHDD